MKGIAITFLSLMFVVACNKQQEPQLYFISSEDATLLFAEDGGERTIEFYSSEDWNVSGQTDWCTISKKYGSAGQESINVKVSPNEESIRTRSLGCPERRNIIVIEAGGLSISINIEQEEEKVFYLKSFYEVTSSAQMLEVVVSTNYDDFQINIPDDVNWISNQSIQKGKEKSVVMFQIDENPMLERRECEIEFKYAKGTRVIKINQEANLDLPISFEDNIVKVVCVGRYDTNGDGELSYREASQVNSLPTSFFGTEYKRVVSSFDEFQYFTSVTYIPIECFAYSTLSSIVLPQSVETIGRSAFSGCNKLDNIQLNDGLEHIDAHVFDSCSSLKQIELPTSLKRILNNAFQLTTSLEKIDIPSGVTVVSSGLLGGSAIKSISLPSTLQKIESGAFTSCVNLEELHIPNSVKEIGTGIVVGCENLSLFKGDYASKNGKFLVVNGILKGVALKDMHNCEIPEGILAVGENVFSKTTKINHVTIPSTVVSIGNFAFAWAVGLNSIKLKSEQPPVLGIEVFCENNTEKIPLSRIEVPTDSVLNYQLTSGWSYYRDIIVGY